MTDLRERMISEAPSGHAPSPGLPPFAGPVGHFGTTAGLSVRSSKRDILLP